MADADGLVDSLSFSVWRFRDFRLWMIARFFANFARHMQEVVIAWQIYQLTHSALALGLTGLAEGLPYIGMALWAGHLSDRHQKRRLMLGAQAGVLLSSATLLLLSFLPHPKLIFFYAVIGIVGISNSFEMSSGSAYVQMIFPKHHFPRAAAWNLSLFLSSLILGPTLGGWLLARSSPRATYGLAVGLLVVAVTLTSQLRNLGTPAGPAESESALSRVAAGIRYIRQQRLILAAMSLDMFAVLFGDAVALFPIFADLFHAGPTGLGLLRAAPAVGSLIMALVLAQYPFVKPRWSTLRVAVTIFGIAMIGFALSRNFLLSLGLLAIGGMADSVSVVTRQSIYQALTPDSLRGRVASVSGIFISSSNEIGAFESGLVARLIGTVPSVVFGGTMTLLSVLLMTLKFPRLKSPELEPEQAPPK